MNAIHRFRPVIFLLFVGAFFVTAGTVLFHSFGYRFSFERGIFIYTGSITIQSNPETVVIRVDGEEVPQKSLGIINKSIHIGGLTPGEHTIEVSADGYQTWSKKTTIQSGLSSEFWNVLLIRNDPGAVAIPETDHVIRIFPSLERNIIAAARQNGNVFSVDVIHTDTGSRSEVYRLENASFVTDDDENIEWSPEGDRLIVPVRRTDDQAYLYTVVDITSGSTLSLNALPGIDGALIRSARWDPSTRDTLFFMDGTTLYRTDISAETPQPAVAGEHILAYDLSGRYIYSLSTDTGIVYRSIIGSGNAPEQITLEPVDTSAGSDYALIIYDEDRLTIRDRKSGAFTVFNRAIEEHPLRTISHGIRGSQFSDDGKKILFWSDNEISVYFTEDWETQPFRAADSVIQVIRFSSPIRDVQWTKDYEHVLFASGATAKVAELDHRDRRNIFDIASFGAAPFQILSRFDENSVYFLRSDTGENPALERISFPEASTLFGLLR